MNIRFSVILITGAVISVSALGETKDATTINNEALGRVDGVSAYCIRVDAKSFPKYLERWGTFTRGHSVAEIRADRNSKKYFEALAVISLQLKKVPVAAGAQACKAYLAGK